MRWRRRAGRRPPLPWPSGHAQPCGPRATGKNCRSCGAATDCERCPAAGGRAATWSGRPSSIPTRRAARDAAEATIAAECARDPAILAFLDEAEGTKNHFAIGSAGEALERCRRTALAYAATGGWAPEEPDDDFAWRQPELALHARYARARRDGIFDAAFALAETPCFYQRAETAPGKDTSRDALTLWLRKLQASCNSLVQRRDDGRTGPVAAVLWSAGPRDHHPEHELPLARGSEPELPAAPYLWATDAHGQQYGDACAPFRVSNPVLAAGNRAWSLLRRSELDLCAYHSQARAVWLGTANRATDAWIDHVVAGRVVLVGASSAVSGDVLKMRLVNAPGVWAHAIALRGGSACLNRLRTAAEWMSALSMPRPGLAAAG
jgi:hypothetical protein